MWHTDLHCSAVVSSLCQERLTHTLSIDGPGKWSEKWSGQNLTNLTRGSSPDWGKREGKKGREGWYGGRVGRVGEEREDGGRRERGGRRKEGRKKGREGKERN